ncbi:4Fe-4S dicluster domain-containing protein [Dethiosulfatarculus sandiegensis]|uniref:4Fe-4S ferredoxin n=1 Tax=Dethiosulfatarculus sandiegensis TaxID=1429043 RepID=A0A0D2GLQ1_9BACT|nr:4Fe-4S dicluster domain-containing protein [Dethiosulfatarculus sandiegensis]KIX15602.1 4Fe-4S ferredoxin [Dethiosulfatarculus sandiegensis]
MSAKVYPNLLKELKEFGLEDAGNCYHCGNCTGVCPLSTEDTPFPRKIVRYAQLGLKDKILESPEPWLCYYCGECSDLCPRGADPGETMMVMRRYLTSQYDWTGFAKKFYTSEIFEIMAVSIVAILVGLGFVFFANWGASHDVVQLNTFAPNWIIEILDWIMAVVLSAVLLSNVYRCAQMVTKGELKKIPISLYLAKAKDLLIHTVTQKQFSKCEDRKQWIIHLLIMTGYSSVFLMVVVGLRWFQRDSVIDPEWPTISVLMTIVGYYATAAIMYGTTYALIGRIKKSKAPYKNSHGTDWMFLALLQLTTLTGILVHAFIFLGWALPVYIIYVIHLMVAIPMLVLEVPFAKWAHLAYRPVVLFLTQVQKEYAEQKKQSQA